MVHFRLQLVADTSTNLQLVYVLLFPDSVGWFFNSLEILNLFFAKEVHQSIVQITMNVVLT